MSAPCQFEHDDGAYVLGALSPEDRVAFERHLPGCADCTRRVRELAGIPGLLARLPVEIVDPKEPPQPVPDTLLPALVRRVRRTQRRRAWIAGGLVAAAAAIAVGAVGVATLGGDDSPPVAGPSPSSGPTTAAPEPMRPVGAEPVSGWVSLTQVGWGTRLDLTCSYAEAGDAGYHDEGPPTYTMYVTTAAGGTEQVASWKGLPGKTMHLTGATSADADDIVSVEIRGNDEPVLELDS